MQITLSLAGTVVFKPSDIISIDKESSSFGVLRSIRISHKVANYSKNIVFKPIENPEYVISEIKRIGFLNNTDQLSENIEREISVRQASGSYPLKKNITIAIVVLWNVLCLPALLSNTNWGIKLRFVDAMTYPLVFMLSFCLCLLFFKSLQDITLKKCHYIDELRTGIIFIGIICFFLLSIVYLLSA